MASRFSRALGVLRRAQRSHGSHGAIVPLGARPHGPHLNALAAAGIVLGSSLVSCKEKKATKATKVEVKDCRLDWSWKVRGLMMLMKNRT